MSVRKELTRRLLLESKGHNRIPLVLYQRFPTSAPTEMAESTESTKSDSFKTLSCVFLDHKRKKNGDMILLLVETAFAIKDLRYFLFLLIELLKCCVIEANSIKF